MDRTDRRARLAAATDGQPSRRMVRLVKPFAVASALLAALNAGVALAQTVPSPPPSVQTTTPHYRAAYAFAQELRDRDSMLVQLSHVFSGAVAKQLALDPDVAAAEKKYPGLINAMLVAARPEIERAIVAALPDLWTSLADLFAAEMTDQELATGMAHYSSPPGRRLKAILLKHYNYEKELGAAGPDFDKPVDPNTIRSAVADAVPATLADMSASDKAALAAFARTPAFAKVQKLNQRVLQIVAAWSSSPNPEAQARVTEIMRAASKRFVADAGPKA